MRKIILVLAVILSFSVQAQKFTVSGTVSDNNQALAYSNIYISKINKGAVTNQQGFYQIRDLKPGTYKITSSYTGYTSQSEIITITNKDIVVNFSLIQDNSLDEVVVTGTLKAVKRLDSPVPVEVYSSTFLKKNPTTNIFEALQNVNGVRPQLNCSVCNTGDIHINGLEGPYTLVLIDGMPIVSGLSTVYGLSGIPNSLIEQVEIVKGPASSLYGSEAVGGLINIITKLPENAPIISADVFSTTWGEVNTDIGFKAKVSDKVYLLGGVNYFNYSNPIDNNNDNFTDVTLQDRISVFQKWDFKRKNNRKFTLAGRYFYEDRWGGEMQWNPSFRGGDQVYGESIYTSRYEIIGNYQLPITEKVNFQFSYSDHDQNSAYGDTPYLARQKIGFGQFTWDKPLKNHDILLGAAARYNFYNDNTPATLTSDEIVIPSLFVQDEIKLAKKHSLLLGARYDYNKNHGSIFTPRLAYRIKPTKDEVIRFNAGTGFRVVNLFTEEHAALTGARDVVITEKLDPERSYNANLNYLKKVYSKKGQIYTFDASLFYTYFTNAIIPDYDTNPNQIIYSNLNGYSTSIGGSINIDAIFNSNWKTTLGVTIQEVNKTEDGIKKRQILTEGYSGTWGITYTNHAHDFHIDYTGSAYGPMRLPTLGPKDPRPEYSPIWSLQNIQITYDRVKNFEFYGGVKNLLNWTPNEGIPFLIARANDPFDKNVNTNNPNGLTFDPTYIYAPNQGIRGFFGVRYKLK